MKTLARGLVWAATLIAAADCPAAAVTEIGKCDAVLTAERPQESSKPHSGSQLHQQRPAPCAMADGRRVRQSRGRAGYSLDDWFPTVLDCVRWLHRTLGAGLACCIASLISCLVGLCLTTSARGQDGTWFDRLPLLTGESAADSGFTSLSTNIPPRENAIFGPPPPSDDVRYLPEGNGWIVVADPMAYPSIPALDCDIPGSIFYTYRANLFGIDVPDEWDFYNLISTDRPDFTDATFSAGKGVTIIETGYTFRKAIDTEANTEQSRRSLPEALVRHGLTNEFELRFKWNGYVMSDLHNLNTGARTQLFGGDDLIAAIKYEVWQQNGALPMLTFLTGSTLPSGTNGISSNQMQPFINFVAGWGLRRWLYLKLSTGIDWQKTSISTLIGGGSEPFGPIVVFLRDNINVYHFSSSLLYQALPRVGGFVEFFGFAQTGGHDNRPAIYFDTGLYLYATTSVQFDVRYGVRLSERVDELFAGAGFSVRY